MRYWYWMVWCGARLGDLSGAWRTSTLRERCTGTSDRAGSSNGDPPVERPPTWPNKVSFRLIVEAIFGMWPRTPPAPPQGAIPVALRPKNAENGNKRARGAEIKNVLFSFNYYRTAVCGGEASMSTVSSIVLCPFPPRTYLQTNPAGPPPAPVQRGGGMVAY